MPFIGAVISRAALGAALFVWAGAMQAVAANDGESLLAAARSGDVAAAHRLLRQGVKPDARDAERRTALLIATRANHVAVARALIEAGADVNAKDNIQDSPFLYAGAEGRLEILK